MGKKLTHEEFLEKLWESSEHYRDGVFNVTGIYNGGDKNIEIEGELGKCSVNAASLFRNTCLPTINTAINKTEYFKNEVYQVNSYYREGMFEITGQYTGRKQPIEVKYDNLYFDSPPSALLADYLPTIKTASNKDLYCIQNFKKLRLDFKDIDYSKVKYSTSTENLIFKCKIHNLEYSQRIYHHNNGVQGCIKCMKYPIMYNEDTIVKHKEFLENVPGVLYIIKLESHKEVFYKVGITGKNRIKYRFSELEKNYKVSFEYLQEGVMTELFKLEQFFLKDFKNKQYFPKIKFRGYTECLTTNPVAEYYHWFNNK